MSIINEALKKTQDRLHARQPTPSRQFADNTKWLWLLGAFVITGFASCLMIFFFFINTQNLSLLPAARTASPRPALPPASTSTPPPSAQSSSKAAPLILNGIIASGDEGLALINNRIYKKGDSIGDKRVLKIYRDKVEISNKGEIITLTTE